MNFEKCSEENRNKVISVSENRRTFVIKNGDAKLVNKVEVDGCLIDGDRKKCDYLFEIDKPMTLIIYVELKGKDIEHAYDQLAATIGYCKNRHNKLQKQCYIVASRVPKSGPKIQILKQKMAREYKIQMFVHTQKAEIKI